MNVMKLSRMLSLLAGVVFACHSFIVLAESTANSAANAATAAANARHIAPPNNGLWIHESPQGLPEGTTDSKLITLTLPTGAQLGSLEGRSERKGRKHLVQGDRCTGSEGVCATALLSLAEGLRHGKNVLYATAANSDGTLVSSRLRFTAGSRQVPASQTSYRRPSRLTTAMSGNGIADSNFTPPTVTFKYFDLGRMAGKYTLDTDRATKPFPTQVSARARAISTSSSCSTGSRSSRCRVQRNAKPTPRT